MIRSLYDLYEQRGTVRDVKHAADRLGLCTRRRIGSDGSPKGGISFDRGHIYHLLTNPIYAGRIRHKGKVFDGQHGAIIDPDRWDRIQERLKAGAAKSRARKTAKQTSLLCGKLFDETGDRLTPSHSKTKSGARLRYYVSHRLIKKSGEGNLDGWRLSAQELEIKAADVLRQHICKPSFVGTVLPHASVEAIRIARDRLTCITSDKKIAPLLNLVERIDIAPGELAVTLWGKKLAEHTKTDEELLEAENLSITAPFQLRKRGVETKLILRDVPGGLDETLIRKIAKAHLWFEQIKAGKTLSEIAKAEGTTNGRLYQLIDLAFLAPDIIRDVLDGKQPVGFTSDWCVRHSLPVDWEDQRVLIATL